MADRRHVVDDLDQAVHSFENRLRVIVELGTASVSGHPNDLRQTIACGLHELLVDYDRVLEASRALLDDARSHPRSRSNEPTIRGEIRK